MAEPTYELYDGDPDNGGTKVAEVRYDLTNNVVIIRHESAAAEAKLDGAGFEVSDIITAAISGAVTSAEITDLEGNALAVASGALGVDANSITESEIAAGAVTEALLDALDSPSDGEHLSWNQSQSQFEWVAAAGGGHSVENDGTELTASVSVLDFQTGLAATEPTADEIDVNLDESVIKEGGAKEIDAAEFSAGLGNSGYVLQSDGTSASWSLLDLDDLGDVAGVFSITSDVLANQPAAGTADRIYIAEDVGVIYRDNGTSWDVIAVSDAAIKDGGQVEVDVAELAAAMGTSGQVIQSDGLAASWVTLSASDISDVSPDSVSDAHHAKYTDEEAQDAVGTITDSSIAYDDAAPSISTAERVTYEIGHVNWPTTSGFVEIHRFDLRSGEVFHLERIEFRQKGGGTNTSATVRVFDNGAGAAIDSANLGSTSVTGGSSNSGAVILVEIDNGTGGAINASPIVRGHIA